MRCRSPSDAAVHSNGVPRRTSRRGSHRAGHGRVLASAAQAPASPHSVLRTLQHQLRTKQRSSVEVTDAYLAAIQRSQSTLNAFTTVCGDLARAQAQAADARRTVGTALGPLDGIPVSVKDNLCTRGVATTAGSRVLSGYVPPYDATSWARLSAAGAVLLGKTNMDEFGMGSSTERSAYGHSANPWDVTRVPGGSSGGAAAAVAANLCAAALGSDTGGSVRQPAAFCGAVGLKPTYGRVSRSGLIAYASSLDVVGTLTTSVEDAALLLGVIAGRDPADATTADVAVPDFCQDLLPASGLTSRPLAGVKLGLITQTSGAGVQPGVLDVLKATAAHCESLGATIVAVDLPRFEYGLPAYYIIAPAEASSNLARYDGLRYGAINVKGSLNSTMTATRGTGFGPEVKRRILMGTYTLSAGYIDAYYTYAQRVRALIRTEMLDALSTCDALLSPVAPSTAFRLGDKLLETATSQTSTSSGDGALDMFLGDLMTVNVNLAGLPALSLPCGLAPPPESGASADATLPVGVQLIGRPFGEKELLRIGHAVEVTRPRIGSPPGFCSPL